MANPQNAKIEANDAALKVLYNALAGQAKAGVSAQTQGFKGAAKDVGSIYDEMTNSLRSQANATASGLGANLDMLGIGAATDSATQNLRGQLNQSLISAARRKSTEMAGLTSQGASYAGAGREGITNILREGTGVRADSRTRLEEALASLEAAKVQAQGQYDIQKLQGDVQLAQMRAQARARSGGGGGRSGNPLDALRAQMLGLQILKAQGELEGGNGNQWSKSGQGGLDNFLSNASNYWSGGAGPKVRGALQDIIGGAGSQAINPSSIASGLKDPYTIAMGMVGSNNTVKTDFYRNALRQGLQIYYGKAR